MVKSFSDYYNDALQTKQATKSASKGVDFSGLGGETFKSVDASRPQSPVNWLMDIISRPLYAVTDTARGVLDASDSLARGDVGGALSNVAQHNPFTGFFSTDEANKNTTSGLIERGVDQANRRADPNYVDTANNANPVAKGVLGFAGDVLLDPLTWIPGAQIAKVLKVAGQGAKAASGGAKSALDALRGIEHAAPATEKAAKIADELPKATDDLVPVVKQEVDKDVSIASPKQFQVVGHNGDASFVEGFDTLDDARSFMKTLRRDHGWTSSQSANPRVHGKYRLIDNSKARPVSPQRSLAEAVTMSPKLEGVQTFMDNLSKVSRETSAPVAATPAEALTSTDWLQEVAKKAPKYVVATIGTGRTARKLTAAKAVEYLQGNASAAFKKDVQRQLEVKYRGYAADHKTAVAEGRAVDALGEDTVVTPPPSAVDAMANYRAQVLANEAEVEATLGTSLFNYMKLKRSPAQFEDAVASIRRSLSGESDLERLVMLKNTEGATTRALLKSFGVDTDFTKVSSMQDAATPVTEANILARTGGNAEQWALDDADTINKAVKRELFSKESYDPMLTTDKGVLRSDSGLGPGIGRFDRELNGFSQYTLWAEHLRKSVTRLQQTFKERGLWKDGKPTISGKGYAVAMKSEALPNLRRMDKLMDVNGIPLYIGVGIDKVPLSTSQMIDVLDEVNSEAMLPALWNLSSAVPLTNLQRAVVRAIDVNDPAGREEIMASLLNTKKYGNKGTILDEKLENNMAENGVYGHLPAGREPKPRAGISYKKNGTKGWWVVYSPEKLAGDVADTIIGARNGLREVVAGNTAALASRKVSEMGDLTDTALQDLETLIADPTKVAETLQLLANIPRHIRDMAANEGALLDSAQAAKDITESVVPTIMQTTAKNGVKIGKARTKAGTDSAAKTGTLVDDDVFEAGKKGADDQWKATSDDYWTQVRQSADELAPDQVLDLATGGSEIGEVVNHLKQAMNPTGRMFDLKYKMKDIWNFYHGGLNSLSMLKKFYAQRLNGIARKYGGTIEGTETKIINKAWDDLKLGVVNTNPQVAAAAKEMDDVLSEIFDTSNANSTLGNLFFRNNNAVDLTNAALDRMGAVSAARFDAQKAVDAARKNGTSYADELVKQWRDWDVEDPLELFNQFYHAGSQLSVNNAVAHSFQALAQRHNLLSDVPKAGYVRFVNSGGSVFMPYLPKNTWYRKDLADQLRVVEERLQETRSLDGSLGDFIGKYYTPIQQAWKKGITIYRPGFHIRNLLSDSGLTFVAEGVRYYRKSAKDALKVMSLRNNYDGADVVQALNSLGEFKLIGKGDIISAGKLGELTADDIYRTALENGLLSTFHVGEGLFDDVIRSSGLQRVMDKLSLTGTPVERVVGAGSEYREHYSRLQHYLQFIHKAQKDGGYTSMEDMLQAASEQVKKFHPDVNMLTGMESKLRTLIPFYSWVGKMIPVIAETIVTRPGRVTAFTKGFYNTAVAMGVNPDSYSDPFPTDQLFPSFLTEQATGPVFGSAENGYFGIHPGFAHLDVLNQFGTDPIRGVAGAISPLIRTPAELLSGTSWGTGGKINDVSDYIDSNLPGVNYLANISGQSVTGSLASLLQGQGLDPQYQVAKGNKGSGDSALSAFNWLSGLGVTNMSKPNYINYAEIEKRNREGGKQAHGF